MYLKNKISLSKWKKRTPDIAICAYFIYLANPGKAMGCSTNTCLTVVDEVSDPLPQLCLQTCNPQSKCCKFQSPKFQNPLRPESQKSA